MTKKKRAGETMQLPKGLTREQAIRLAVKRAKRDARGFTYDPKTGVAVLT